MMETIPDSTENDQNFINIMVPDFNNLMESHLISTNAGIISSLDNEEAEIAHSYGHYSHLGNNVIAPSVTTLAYAISVENTPNLQDRIYSPNLTVATDISPGSVILDSRVKPSQQIVTNALISPPMYPDSTMQNLTIASPVINQTTASLNGSPGSHEMNQAKHLQLDHDVPSSNLAEFSDVIGNVHGFDREFIAESLQYGSYSNLLMNAPPLISNSSIHQMERPHSSFLESSRDSVVEQSYCMSSLKQEAPDHSSEDSVFYSQASLERYELPIEQNSKYGPPTVVTSHLDISSVIAKTNKPTLSVLNNVKKPTMAVPAYVLPELQSNFSSVDSRNLQQVYQQPDISPHCQSELSHNAYKNPISVDNSEQSKQMYTYNNYVNHAYMPPNQSTSIRQDVTEKNNRKAPTRATARSKAKRAKLSNMISDEASSRGSTNCNENGLAERRRKHDNFNCGLCDTKCNSRSDLRKHLNEVHAESGPEPADHPNKKYSCGVSTCSFVTYIRAIYDDHVAMHIANGYTPTGKYRQGKAKNDLMRHRYNKEEFHCIKCPYNCTIEASFKRHMRNHDLGIEVFTQSCSVCGEDFREDEDLKTHMDTHRNCKYFLCDICQFNTVQLKKLIQHRRMHTGEKPHLCPFCHYRAARRDNLRSHVRRMHSKENMYSDTFTPKSLVYAEINQDDEESQVINQQLMQQAMNNQM